MKGSGVYERVGKSVISICKKAKTRGIKLAHRPSFTLRCFSAGNAEKNNNRNVVEGAKT